MFIVNTEEKSLYVTRGDVGCFSVSSEMDDGEMFKFQPGDVVRFKVTEKKACDKVVLSKDVGVEAETEEVLIYLEEKDTKIGDVISKPVEYWYEVELNPYTDPQTILGYDEEDGPKIFKLFPEGGDVVDEEPITPEDIPVVDEELSLTSTRPVQNQAIARAFTKAREDVAAEMERHGEYIEAKLSKVKEVEEELDRIAEETEVKLSRLDEFATELGRFDEIEAKLTKVDENTERLNSLDVEDITNSFATMTNNAQMMSGSSVYRQGNVIHGSLKISAPFMTEPPIFTVNELYRPRNFALCVAKFVEAGTEDEYGTADAFTSIPVGLFGISNETGICNRVYPVMVENSSIAFIDFTYICE